MTTPIPTGRGRWRLTLHNRVFSGPIPSTTTGIGELVDARSRVLTQAWNTAAKLDFVLDGHSASAALIRELQHDVVAWRWDETLGRDVIMFRGPITNSEDEVSEQTHTTTYTCHDYFALLNRRFIVSAVPYGFTGDQDTIVQALLVLATTNATNTGGGTSFMPGSYLPLEVTRVNPDGSIRTQPGPQRVRSYPGNSEIGTMIDELAHVINGFDYDVRPRPDYGVDQLRIFYPAQGVTRSNVALVYGSTVASFTRTTNSDDYSNYWRVLGNNGDSDPATPQLYAEAWNTDANNVTVLPVGLWANTDNAADVSDQQTLTDKANADLALSGVLMPSYSLGLRPGWYSYGLFNMGDTLPLILRSGRLNVNTTTRVLGIAYTIGDDGQEDVGLTVGRPAVTLAQILTDAHHDINALVRR